MPPNENKISDGYPGASANRGKRVFVIGKRDRAPGWQFAASCLVRSLWVIQTHPVHPAKAREAARVSVEDQAAPAEWHVR